MSNTLTEEQRQQQRIITGLHKAANKEGMYKPSAEMLREQSLAYEQDIVNVHDKLSFMGIHRLSHFYFGHHTARSIEGAILPVQEELRKDSAKEESYSKKVSKQEKAAIERGEYAEYRLGQGGAAVSAMNQYREYQEHPETKPRVEEINGDEFLQKPDESEAEVSARICGLMLSRDKLKAEIDRYGPDPADPVYKILVKHLNELLSCTNDAISTWQRANGVDADGNPIPEKEIEKAKHHLPLALEKYRYESRHNKGKYGAELMSTLKKKREWKDEEREFDEVVERVDQEDQRISGISSLDTADYNSVQSFIVSHPAEYAAHKTEVDKAFAMMTSRLRKINELTKDIRVTQTYLIKTYGTTDDRFEKASIGRDGLEDVNNYTLRVMKYQSECAGAYIKFLLNGRKTDPLHAEFIRRTWGVDAEVRLDASFDEIRHARDQFTVKLRNLRETSKPEERAVLEKLESTQDNSICMRECLEEVSDVNLARKAIQKKLDDDGTGYRDIVRALSPMYEMPDMKEDDLMHVADNLNILQKGKSRDGMDYSEDEEKLLASMRELIPAYCDQVDVMRNFMGSTGLLEPRTADTLLQRGEHIPAFYKKAQGIRDAMAIMFRSPAFDLLDESEQNRLTDDLVAISAMTSAAENVFIAQKAYCVKTYQEYNEAPPTNEYLDNLTYESQVRENVAFFERVSGRTRAFKGR